MASRNLTARVGFSLLELIIVLMIMVGLLAVAWPNLQRPLRTTSLSQAALTLRAAIDDCRYQAITSGTPVFIHLRPSNGEFQSGTFSSFLNDDRQSVDFSTSTRDSNGESGSSLQPASIDRDSDVSAPKSWSLPQDVVIYSVSWTLDAPSFASSDEYNSENSSLAESDAASDGLIAEVQSESSFADAFGPAKSEWWLPMSATGQSRDATIVLIDTSINQQMTVTYSSATGALEITR